MNSQSTTGASLQLHAQQTLASIAAVQRFQEQLFDILSQQLPVAITVRNLGDAKHADTAFSQVCALLETVVKNSASQPQKVSLAIDAAPLSPQLLWMRRRQILGVGPLYLLLDSELTRPSSDRAKRRRQDQFWQQCWHLRNTRQVRTAFAPMVSSPCPLLASELASGIVPDLGLQAPIGSSWVSVALNLMDYSDAGGELNSFALRDSLRRCVEHGEMLHDGAHWPTAAMQHDAWLNRRLAISVTGIGDLAKARGLDPHCFAGLKNLQAVLQEVRDTVNKCSRKMACDTEPVPSLELADPSRGPAEVPTGMGWASRWQSAMRYAAIRHRNLVSMSPWAVFPRADALDSRYCDLLPLLRYADACSFPETSGIRGWNINEFKHFHRRAWAVLEQKDAQQMIAEQV